MLFLGCIITNSSEYLNTPFEKKIVDFFGMLCLCEGKIAVSITALLRRKRDIKTTMDTKSAEAL
jgi:hypothetical protein